MDKSRNNKDNTRREKDDDGSEKSYEQRRKEDRPPAKSKEEEVLQVASNVNEQVDDEYGSQEHLLIEEIEKSRRDNVDESSPLFMKILEKKRSHDISNIGQKTLPSNSDEKQKYANSNHNGIDERNKPLLTEYEEEIIEPELENPDKNASNNMQHGQENSIGNEDKADHNILDQETNNFEDETFVKPNADALNEQSPNFGEDEGQIQRVSNMALEWSHSFKGEKELFSNPNQEQKSLSNKSDFTADNQSIIEEKMSVNTEQDATNTEPARIFNKSGEEIAINPENNALDRQHEQNSNGSEKDRFKYNPYQLDRTSENSKSIVSNPSNEKMSVNTEQDATNTEPARIFNKSGEEIAINPENDALDRQHEQNSNESEKDTFKYNPYQLDGTSENGKSIVSNPSNDKVSNYNRGSRISSKRPYNEGEDEISVVNPDQSVLDEQNYDESAEKGNSDSDILNEPSSSEKGTLLNPVEERVSSITSVTEDYAKGGKIFDNPSNSDLKGNHEQYFNENTSFDPDNDDWDRKSEREQGLNREEKEIFFNPHDQAGSLSSSRFFTPNQFIKSGKETIVNPDQSGMNNNEEQNFNTREGENRNVNLYKERVSHQGSSARGSAVKFTDGEKINNVTNDKRASGSDGYTPVKSPKNIRMVDMVLRPTQQDNNNKNPTTETMKTMPAQRKKEVIRINRDLAPAVILLLKKLEQYQDSSKSPSHSKPIVAQETQKYSDDERKTKDHRDSNKYTPEGSNLKKMESKKRRSSTLNDNIEQTYKSENPSTATSHMNENESAEDKFIVIRKSSRATSTSTLPHFCSSPKCQRTCKKCSQVKRANQKEDSPNLRRERDMQEDSNIVPALEVLAEKLKNGLKTGCSLLKNFYYNQNLVRVYYFQTHPDDGNTNEEL